MDLLSLFSGSHNINYQCGKDDTINKVRISGEDISIEVETLKSPIDPPPAEMRNVSPIAPILLGSLPTLIEIGTNEAKRAIKRNYAAYVATYSISQTLYDTFSYQNSQRYRLKRTVIINKNNVRDEITACKIQLLRRSWNERHVYQVESIKLPISKARAEENDQDIQLSVGISEVFWDTAGSAFKTVMADPILLPPVRVGSGHRDLSYRNLFSLPFPNPGADQIKITVTESNASKQPYKDISEDTDASLDDIKTLLNNLQGELEAERKTRKERFTEERRPREVKSLVAPSKGKS